MFKTCTKCGQEKPHLEFYQRQACCKECWKARVRARARSNPAVQAYDRERAKTTERRQRARQITLNWRADNPLAYKAQTAVGNALRDGKLTKMPCEVCGERRVHAHHDDYARPLEVRWLCALHHHRHHADTGLEGANKRAAQGGAVK